MSRLGLGLCVIVTVLSTGCSKRSATDSSDAAVSNTFPAVGDKWVIGSDYGDLSQGRTHEVTEVDVKDGVYLVTENVTRDDSKQPGTIVRTRVSDKGTYLLQEGTTRYDPPICVLPKPVSEIKEGTTWEVQKPGKIRWTFTAGKEEEVSVPAGKFTARRIEVQGEGKSGKYQYTEWIVSGYPTIRRVTRTGDGNEIVEVLKSFTRGKK